MVEGKFPTGGQAQGTETPKEAYTFTASNKTDHEKDVDIAPDSLHHTIGKGPTQVASGDHKHGIDDVSGAVLDHGALSGLSDDDHAQYLNAARGDVRYPLKNGTGATGTWNITATGNVKAWTYDPGAGALRVGDLLLY